MGKDKVFKYIQALKYIQAEKEKVFNSSSFYEKEDVFNILVEIERLIKQDD